MSKFTPGPWEVEYGTNEQGPMIAAEGCYIAVVFSDVRGYGANANLLAAAPELVAALSELLFAYRECREAFLPHIQRKDGNSADHDTPAMQRAAALIKRIKGE